jgi:hypothetical protein
MYRMLGVALLAAGLAGVAYARSLMGAVTEVDPLMAASLRGPIGMLWIVGPMLLGVAGAVTVGWRRGLHPGGDAEGE